MSAPQLIWQASTVLLGLAMLLAIVRIIRGPTLADRILGLDLLTLLGIGLVAAYAVSSGLPLYLDIGVALCLVGFLTTAAFARYMLSRGEQ